MHAPKDIWGHKYRGSAMRRARAIYHGTDGPGDMTDSLRRDGEKGVMVRRNFEALGRGGLRSGLSAAVTTSPGS
eukprot:7751164-Pyramimonas_sp.AAC.1